MITKENIKWISTLSGVSEEEISGALTNGEEVNLPFKLNGRVITQEDESTLKTKLTDAGIEIGYKKLSKAAGIELANGEKDPLIISEKIKARITETLEEKYKGQTPSDELKTTQEKVIESEKAYNKLLETHEATLSLVNEKDQLYTGLQKEVKTKERNNSILKSFPEKMKMDRGDALLVTTNTFQFEEVDGVTVVKRDGQVVTDGLGKPEKVDNVVKSFVEEKNWVKGSGMGGSDRNHSGSGLPKGMTDDAAMRYMNEKGIDTMTEKGTEMFLQLTSTE